MLPSMLTRSTALLLILQLASAIDIQQNYSICNWARLRSGIVRDAIYLDGGQLWWQTAFADGSTPVVASDGNVAGDMWRLNLSTPFDTTKTNLSALLDTMPKAGGAGNNIAPNYIDGAMFTNHQELYLYGGLPRLTDSASPQSENTVLGYEAYQYGAHRESWAPGFYQGGLTEGVTRYVTNGAGTSAPSENLGFYFSGMRAPDWGPIYYDDASASVTANTLIEVDLSTMRDEQWSNTTLPDDIEPRANAELVWLPVSERGVLIAIGGVTSPEEISPTGLNESEISESKSVSPSFMKSIPIYDVASKTWYLQNTTGQDTPPQLTEFCSVVATTDDPTTFNIYIYGGYDGLTSGDMPSDDVWVLSIPSFQWVKAYTGTSSHGRSGHRCMSPYPDKMMVIGGIHQNQAECLEGGYIQIFNLNSLEFQDAYDPNDWQQYEAPSTITSAVGGSKKRQVAWSDPALADIFSTKYTKPIKQYYPFESDATPDNDDGKGQNPEPSTGKKSNKSHTIAIAVGVAAGVVALILVIVLLLILRRRHIMRSNGSESTGTKQSRISQWVYGTRPSPSHPNKHISNDSVSSLGPETKKVDYGQPVQVPHSDHHEPPYINNDAPYKRISGPQEMAAVERPAPPFEMATPYNDQDAPRNSNRVSYGYSTAKGHSPSRSTSSDYHDVDAIHEHSSINSTTHLHPAHAYQHNNGPNNRASTSTNSTSSTSSTLAWPFPAEPKRYSGPHPEPAPVPPIPSKYQAYRSVNDDSTPNRLHPTIPEGELSRNSTSATSSSGPKVSDISGSSNYDQQDQRDLESLPSPESSLPPPGTKYGDDMRRSMFERVESDMISPISPDHANAPGWKGMWGYGANQPSRQLPADWRPGQGQMQGRRSGEEQNESWWKR